MIHRHTRHPRALTLAISVGFLTMVAACGGGGSSSEVASLGAGDTSAATETTTAEDTQQQWLDFAQCMRDNGVDMQDPTFDADGNLQGGFGPAAGLDPQDENTQTALQACRDLMPAFGPGSGGGPQFDRTAIQDAFNQFTSCLREQGLEVDDIDFAAGPGGGGQQGPPPTGDFTPPAGGGGFGGGPPQGAGDGDFDPTARIIEQLGLDGTDPAVTAAVDACSSIINDAFQQRTDTTGGS